MQDLVGAQELEGPADCRVGATTRRSVLMALASWCARSRIWLAAEPQ